MILLFASDAITEKRGDDLSNDVTQAIPHSHSWGGFLHFRGTYTFQPQNGSTTPTVFCSEKNLATALRVGCESVESMILNIRESLQVTITDRAWEKRFCATPAVHFAEALGQLDPAFGPSFHQACARIRKTMDFLPNVYRDDGNIISTFIQAAQSAIAHESLPIDVRDGKTVAFPPTIGHFRDFQGRFRRPESEVPFGGKIDISEPSWRPSRSAGARSVDF